MKNKVGILTFHFAHNYGAVLQTYALYKTIENFGYTPIVINRVPNKVKKNSFLKTIKFRINKLINIFLGKSFDDFIKNNIRLSKKVKSTAELSKLKEDWKYIIVGSDQVWRLDYTIGLDYDYYLGWVPENIIKISYAASFGKDKYDESIENIKTIKNALSKFNSISVREDSGIKICSEIFGLESELTLDPTFLLQANDYRILIKDNSKIDSKIVYYILDPTIKKTNITNHVSKELNLELKNISRKSNKPFSFRYFKFNLFDFKFPSVDNWIKGIIDAEYIITDSFHGTVFSIIYNKQFIVIINEYRGISRLKSLLSLLNLESRIVNEDISQDELNILLSKHIDYIQVNKKLEKLKNNSLNFLLKSLNSQRL